MIKMSLVSAMVASTVSVLVTLALGASFKASESDANGRSAVSGAGTPVMLPWCEDGSDGPCLYPDDSLVLWFPNSEAFYTHLRGNK